MCQFDAMFGGRIHGSMVGIWCELPVFIVAPDMRVKELGDAMSIPNTDIFDKRFAGVTATSAGIDAFEFLKTVEFDGAAFDAKRCAAAQAYMGWLNQHNIPHNPAFSNLCQRARRLGRPGQAKLGTGSNRTG